MQFLSDEQEYAVRPWQKTPAVPSSACSAAAVAYTPHAPLQPLKDFTACGGHWHFQGSRWACPPRVAPKMILY